MLEQQTACPLVSLPESIDWQAEYFSPFAEWLRDAVMSSKRRRASIPHVRFLVRPATVTRFVVAVIVDAVQLHAGRWMAHVCKKVLDLLPAVADLNATRPIQTVCLRAGVLAPVQHGIPNHVELGIAKAVSAKALASPTAVQASARFLVSDFEGVASGDGLIPAIASARPENAAAISAQVGSDRKTTETLSGQVDECGTSQGNAFYQRKAIPWPELAACAAFLYTMLRIVEFVIAWFKGRKPNA